MNETTKPWSPTVRSYLEVLKFEIADGKMANPEVPLPGLPVESTLGRNLEGDIWLSIQCDPESVSVDDSLALVSIKKWARGYQILVNGSAEESAAVRLFEEVIELLGEAHPPGDAGRAALQNWRELLAKPAGARLSENALVGLFGELEVLSVALDHGGSLDWWTGWEKDRVDFRAPGLAIEVKSTMSAEYRRVKIHGLQQLAAPSDGSDLVLALRRLERSPHGLSLPDLINELCAKGVARSSLLERLSHVGYFETHQALYEGFRLVSQEVALRLVNDSHPRLTPDSLSSVNLNHIDRVDYELNLNDEHDTDLQIGIAELFENWVGEG